jgi:CDP-diacylglycerol pyrophosphatase
MHGYLMVPSDPLVGMEAITQGTASYYNFLWCEAASQATEKKRSDNEHWALLVNPSMSRTQHQLHIFFKPMSDNGCVLRQQLEALTQCDVDAGWVNVAELGMCIFMRARVYNELPGVFSEVWADAAIDSAHLGPLFENPQGDQHMGSIGITVMFGCENRVILLSTSGGGAYCSLEHSIT